MMNVPGLRRANDFTSDSTAPGSRSPSHDAAPESRVETWFSRSTANPGFCAFAVNESSSSLTERSPAAARCCCTCA